jgi:hypothetical protein
MASSELGLKFVATDKAISSPPGPGVGQPKASRNVSPAAGEARVVLETVQASIKEIQQDIREIRSFRHTDFTWTVTIFGLGFLLVAGMLIVGYFRLDDRLARLSESSIRTETKLEDLLQRIPAVPAPAQNKQP